MDLPFQKKKPKKALTPLEQRERFVAAQQSAIDTDFEKKLFVEKYGKSLILASILVVLFFFGMYGFFTNFQFVKDLFRTEPKIPQVIVDAPPEGFKITSETPTIIQNSDGETYDVFTRMINSDQEWGVSHLSYIVELLDASGKVIGSRKGDTYILPKSRKALAEINVPASGIPKSLRFNFEPEKVQKLRDFGTIELLVTNVIYSKFGTKGRAKGTFVNKSPFAFESIDIVVVLFNKNQEIVGVNKTVIGSVLSSQQRDFSVTWPEYLGDDIQAVVEPSIDVFTSSNFLNTFSQTQELDF